MNMNDPRNAGSDAALCAAKSPLREVRTARAKLRALSDAMESQADTPEGFEQGASPIEWTAELGRVLTIVGRAQDTILNSTDYRTCPCGLYQAINALVWALDEGRSTRPSLSLEDAALIVDDLIDQADAICKDLEVGPIAALPLARAA